MYLNAHTHFSLKYGTLSVAQLVQAAKDCGISRLALTDINNTSATLDFVNLCKQAHIRPVVGIEFRRDHRFLYLGLAQRAEGFYQLNRFLTEHSFQSKPLPDNPPELPNVCFVLPWGSQEAPTLRPDQYLGVRPHQLGKLFRHPDRFHPQLVALNSITLAGLADYEVHQTLLAMDQNALLSQVDLSHAARPNDYCQSAASLRTTYGPFAHLLDRADQLLQTCSIKVDFRASKNKRSYTNSVEDDYQLLHKLAWEGFFLPLRRGSDRAPTRRAGIAGHPPARFYGQLPDRLGRDPLRPVAGLSSYWSGQCCQFYRRLLFENYRCRPRGASPLL